MSGGCTMRYRTQHMTTGQSQTRIEISMRTLNTLITSILFVVFCADLAAQTQLEAGKGPIVPRLIRYSGAYRATGSQSQTGTVAARFAIYRDETGGTPLWSETQNLEVDATGNYVAMLG